MTKSGNTVYKEDLFTPTCKNVPGCWTAENKFCNHVIYFSHVRRQPKSSSRQKDDKTKGHKRSIHNGIALPRTNANMGGTWSFPTCKFFIMWNKTGAVYKYSLISLQRIFMCSKILYV